MSKRITLDDFQKAYKKMTQEPTQEELEKYYQLQDEFLPTQKKMWAYILNDGEPITIAEYRKEFERAYNKVYGEPKELKEQENE